MPSVKQPILRTEGMGYRKSGEYFYLMKEHFTFSFSIGEFYGFRQHHISDRLIKAFQEHLMFV